MAGDNRSRFKQLVESGEISLHPLSFPQRELWEAMAVPVSDPANHICSILHVIGIIPPDICREVIQRVVDRHDVLRLSFIPGSGGQNPVQMVRRSAEVNFRVRELSSEQQHPEAVEEVLQEIFSAPFDLVRGPLYRVELVVRGPTDMMLVLAIHHAVADGWTLGVFLQDLGAALFQRFKGGGALPPVPMSYQAWSAAESAQWQPAELVRCGEFWKTRLKGAPRTWSTSPDAVAPASHKLQRWTTNLSTNLTSGLRNVVRRTHTTLFSALLTGFNIALSRWTKAQDIVVGTPVANRSKPAIRETMGYFSGVVPLRNQVDEKRSFSDLLASVHGSTMDSFAHAMPFAELMKAVGDKPGPGHHPIFDVRFALQNHPVPDMVLPSISIKLRMRSTGTSRFDLGCEVTEDGDMLEVVWLWKSAKFSREDLGQLSALYESVLTDACRAPESLVTALAT